MADVTERTIVITGGSRGIGAATALLAAERGYHVAVNYRSKGTDAETVVQKIKDGGGSASAFQADVSSEQEVKKLFSQVDEALPPLHALVNNAGVISLKAPLVETAAEDIQRVLDLNVVGSFLCAREAARRLSTRLGGVGGSIINVSSIAARLGSPNEFVHYAASKGAIDTMTVGLATELASEGVRVNAVRPGLIETDLHADTGHPNRVREKQSIIPMNRSGSAEEVAQAICWLFSDQASYTTGALLDVGGGL